MGGSGAQYMGRPGLLLLLLRGRWMGCRLERGAQIPRGAPRVDGASSLQRSVFSGNLQSVRGSCDFCGRKAAAGAQRELSGIPVIFAGCQ